MFAFNKLLVLGKTIAGSHKTIYNCCLFKTIVSNWLILKNKIEPCWGKDYEEQNKRWEQLEGAFREQQISELKGKKKEESGLACDSH